MNPLSAIKAFSAFDPATAALAPAASPLPRAIPLAEANELVTAWGPQTTGAAPADGAFSSLLGGLVSDVNAKQLNAGETVAGLLGGQNVSLHQAMVAMEEANISFQLMVEVRNKLLESYQELMRMQV